MPRWRATAIGGCFFAEDPERDMREAQPFWDPDQCPHVLRLTVLGGAGPPEIPAQLATGLHPAREVWADARTLHVLYGSGDRSLQIRMRWFAGTGPAYLSVELPTSAGALGPWLNTLTRFSRLQATGPIDKGVLPDPRGRRLHVILCALDGSLSGASQREIATMLVGPERAEEDWRHPGQHLRDRVRRAVKRGHALMNGGYLELLG